MMDIIKCTETIHNAINQLTTASDIADIVKNITDVKSDNREKVSDLITNMKTTAVALNSVVEVFDTIYDTMIVACMLSVYAGKIEESGHWDENDPDADSIVHIQDYIKMAFQYDIPKSDKGENIINIAQYELFQVMKDKYRVDNEADTSENLLQINEFKSINDIISRSINLFNKYYKYLYKLNKLSNLLNNENLPDFEHDNSVINECIKDLRTIPIIIRVALMAAVYAGDIEGSGWGFENEFGADSLSHLDEYLKIAEQYKLPFDDDGKIATDCVHTDISNIVHGKYNNKKNSNTDNSET